MQTPSVFGSIYSTSDALTSYFNKAVLFQREHSKTATLSSTLNTNQNYKY